MKRPPLSRLLAVGISVAMLSNALAYNPYRHFKRWTDTATGSEGTQGDPITITWSLVPDGTELPKQNETDPGGPSDLISVLDANYGNTGATLADRPWFPIFADSLNRWGEISGITFVYEPNDDGYDPVGEVAVTAVTDDNDGVPEVRGDIRIGGNYIDGAENANRLAFSNGPDSGDLIIDTANVAATADLPDVKGPLNTPEDNYSRFRHVIAHEMGHVLGLQHILSHANLINLNFTDPPKNADPANDTHILMNPTAKYHAEMDGPQFDDILGVQRQNGDALEKNGGNDTTATATDLGVLNSGMMLSIGTDADDAYVSLSDTDFVSIDDETDTDFFSFTLTETAEVVVKLTPKGPTYNDVAFENQDLDDEDVLVTTAMSDLVLALVVVDTDGSTVLETSDATTAGGEESITRPLPPGTYYARVTGKDDEIQMYQLDVAYTSFSPTTYAITPASTTVGEPDGTLDFTITRTGTTLAAETIYARTTQTEGYINAGDFPDINGEAVNFTAGQASVMVSVSITDDHEAESNETFGLIVQEKSDDPPATNLATSAFTIIDDDEAGASIVTNMSMSGETVTLELETVPTFTYTLQYNTSLDPATWVDIETKSGTGALIILQHTEATGPRGFYRIKYQ